MCRLRSSTLAERMSIYEEARIREQREWYATKAGQNKRVVFRWVLACIVIYGTAIASSLYRAANPEVDFSPTDMLIAAAACIVGWVQIKKYNELAASYILTAHEIGLLHATFSAVKEEREFAEFVISAEQAFSREHTQWVARSER